MGIRKSTIVLQAHLNDSFSRKRRVIKQSQAFRYFMASCNASMVLTKKMLIGDQKILLFMTNLSSLGTKSAEKLIFKEEISIIYQ